MAERNALSRAAQVIQQLAPKERLKALLDHSQAREVIRKQPAEDLYVAILDVGLADSMDIVQLTSPAQFRTFMDLGGWKRDRIDVHGVLTWLRAARGDSDEDFFAKLDAIDLEMLEVLLREMTRVHDLTEDPDVNPEGATMETPDNRFLIEFLVDGAEEAALRRLILEMMGRNAFEFSRLLEALRWELSSELEEAAHQFRSGRLQDLGFPPLEEAVQLFTYVKVPSLPNLPSTALATESPASVLEAAARGLAADEWATWEGELRYLVNSALVAEAADPGDVNAIRQVSEMARDYLSLGLERLTGGDPSRATGVLREVTSRRLFQVGFSATLELKYLADAFAKEAGKLWLLPYEAAVVAALRRKRPLRALKVEGAEPVPFRSRRELEEAKTVLKHARAQHTLLSTLHGEDSLEAGPLLHAAVGWALLGERPSGKPVPLERLKDLGEELGHSDAVKRATKALTALANSGEEQDEAARLAQLGVDRLRDELGAVLRSGHELGPELSVILPVSGAWKS